MHKCAALDPEKCQISKWLYNISYDADNILHYRLSRIFSNMILYVYIVDISFIVIMAPLMQQCISLSQRPICWELILWKYSLWESVHTEWPKK